MNLDVMRALEINEFRCYEALLWLSGRALAAQARGVLGSTPGDCRLFPFPLFSPHNI